jgi:prepilin-type N-terminal cleavage/methylation domain-containing protein
MRTPDWRRGFSLLELLVAATLMASIVTAASMVLRSTQTSWTTHVADHQNLGAGYATLRHITRGVRQAESVTAISAPGNLAGSLSVLLSNGQSVVWSLSGTQVNYGVGAPSSLLAYGVTELSFVGYKADGVTTTTVPAEVQSVLCTVKVSLQRSSTPTRTLSSRVWLRAW